MLWIGCFWSVITEKRVGKINRYWGIEMLAITKFSKYIDKDFRHPLILKAKDRGCLVQDSEMFEIGDKCITECVLCFAFLKLHMVSFCKHGCRKISQISNLKKKLISLFSIYYHYNCFSLLVILNASICGASEYLAFHDP